MKNMHRLLMIAAMLTFVSGPGTAIATKKIKIIQTSETKVGEVLFLKLPGNPKGGYKWRLNKELSKGLDLVAVNQIGWIMAPTEKSMFFQNQNVLNVSVRANSSGQADLAFDYYRYAGGRMISKTSMVRGIIKPILASQ
jgi:predicted secreted protein